MRKINKNLEDAVRKNPQQKYRILVTTEEGTDLKQLEVGEANELMENIFSTELKGSKIQSLAKNKKVRSIELDGDMSIT